MNKIILKIMALGLFLSGCDVFKKTESTAKPLNTTPATLNKKPPPPTQTTFPVTDAINNTANAHDVLNNYIKHYKLSNIHKNGQKSLNKNSIGKENPKKISIDNSIFREIENPVRRFQEILAKTKETRILKELRDPYD